MKTLLILCGLSLSTISCDYCSEFRWGYSDGEFDHYTPNLTHTTHAGTQYDPGGQNISPELIDRLTDEAESCLHETFPDGKLPISVVGSSQCLTYSFAHPLDHTSFNVMIPNDWMLSCDSSQEVLPTPVESGDAGCVAKGLDPNEKCPCRWRAGIRCPNTIIATPSMYLYKDALVRFITGCRNPWASPELHKCVSPSTTPLSDGSDPNNGL